MSHRLLTYSTSGYGRASRPLLGWDRVADAAWLGGALVAAARDAWGGRPEVTTSVRVFVTASMAPGLMVAGPACRPSVWASGPVVLGLTLAGVIADFRQVAGVFESDLFAGDPGAMPEPGVSVTVVADSECRWERRDSTVGAVQ